MTRLKDDLRATPRPEQPAPAGTRWGRRRGDTRPRARIAADNDVVVNEMVE